MARKKQADTILLLAGVAVVGYLVFRKGGVLNQSHTSAVAAVPPVSTMTLQDPNNIPFDIPTREAIGLYVPPKVDPSGMQINIL